METIQPQNALPSVTLPSKEIYRTLGHSGVINLVKAVYRLLGKSSIAIMFPETEEALMASAEKSAMFWVTICGGPPLYEQKFGPPRMRARHMDFKIDEGSRLVWMDCWDKVLENAPEDFGFPQDHLEGFREYIKSFSKWMVNS